MNKLLDNKTTLNWLYLDLNSYFASVEQQLQPKLQNKPVQVIANGKVSDIATANKIARMISESDNALSRYNKKIRKESAKYKKTNCATNS